MKLTLTSIVAVAALGLIAAEASPHHEWSLPRRVSRRRLSRRHVRHGETDVINHFAVVIVVGDKGFAYLPFLVGGRKTRIGTVARDGACWSNADGKVCAWEETR